MSAPGLEFRMRLRDLTQLPPITLPTGYAIRTYQEGDAPAWCDIMNGQIGTGWTVERFQEKMLHVPVFRPEGLFFAVKDDVPVASACAWWLPERYGTDTGVLHMVAVHPDQHGQGLGKAISLAVIHYFNRIAMKDCILFTYTNRIPAIRLYLGLGFKPELETVETQAAWLDVLTILNGTNPLSK